MKQASILDVAKRAGVSKYTVYRPLTDGRGVDELTRRKVLEAAHALRYRPNTSARDLRAAGNGRIGMLVPSSHANDFMYRLNGQKLEGAVAAAGALGYDVQMFVYDTSEVGRLDRVIMEKGLAGVLLLDYVEEDLLGCLVEYRIPAVQANWYVRQYEVPQLFVKTDLAEAVRLGMECLVANGYRRIGCHHAEEVRLGDTVVSSAFDAAVARHGLEPTSRQLVGKSVDDVLRFVEQGRFDAFLSFDYTVSMRLYAWCRERHLRIPEDLAVLSYEFFDFFDYVHPRLTGLRQEGERIGREAVEMLDARIRGEAVESRLVPPRLVLRDSCGRESPAALR